MRTIKPSNHFDQRKVIPLEISRMLTISTAHVTPGTLTFLRTECENNTLGLAVYPKDDFGFYIYLPDSECLDAILLDAPEDLQNVLRFCSDVECNVLCLDSDGSYLPYLPSYDADYDYFTAGSTTREQEPEVEYEGL